jgi:TolB-like protein/tRNA A-37 threonylcarbamoyl transferase component Bud32/Flp pilus assembly protein TadD
MIGQTVSHYKILEMLGGGGMGVVYKAQDVKLKRTVALKFLPPEFNLESAAKTRLMLEAQAASALQHHNIVTIHEIDETPDGRLFICMDCYEGQTLKEKIAEGPLQIGEALDIAKQTAEGLAKAHEAGLVHRDIKPANIIVTQDRVVKILDFGLAKLAGATQVTKTGTTVGTIAYMSPEQVTGETVDHRSDLWSLGAVLYEALAGQRPFNAEYEAAILYEILNAAPRPLRDLRPRLPVELERIVTRALAKDPVGRYQSAKELASDLGVLRRKIELGMADGAVSAQEPKASVAVLPFTNMSADREQEYFCDGMAEEIINALTKVQELRVVARTSAFSFKGKTEDVREIGRKLNADAVLEGSVRKAGNRLRVTAQLINVTDGYHVWADRYDGNMEDVFAVQDEISRAIVQKLTAELVRKPPGELVKRYTENLKAYHLYLKGRYHQNLRTRPNLEASAASFKGALQEDDRYALAYAGLADTYALSGFYSVLAPKDAFPRATELALRAIELDGSLAEAYTSLGYARVQYDWGEWDDAERAFLRAIELDPRYATAHHWYGLFLMLRGRMEESVAHAQRALECDPFSLIVHTFLNWVTYLRRDYDLTVAGLRTTLEFDPNFVPAHFFLGLALAQQRKFDEAVLEFERADVAFGGSGLFRAARAYALPLAGRQAEAEKILDGFEDPSQTMYVPRYYVAAARLAMGQTDRAFDELERAFAERDFWLMFLSVDPIFDTIRSAPRFATLLARTRR